MRSPRRFQPSAPDTLEGRVVPSTVAPSPPVDPVSAALLAGQTVTDHETTTEYDGLVQTNDQTTVMIGPDTDLVTQHIKLAGDGGSETIVDIETFTKTGVTRQYTITEPDGEVETERQTEVYTKDGSTRTGTIHRPDGVVITFSGKSVNKGSKTTTTESFVESNGVKYKEHNVSTSLGNLATSSVNTTTWSDGSIQVDKSRTTDTRTL